MSKYPPGFRPLDEFLAEVDEKMFAKLGIHWFLMKGRAKRRINRQRLVRLWLTRPLHWLCRLRGVHWWSPPLHPEYVQTSCVCYLCGRGKRIVV